MLNTEMQPTLANCPSVVSKYTRGIPQITSVKKYGMRNAPVNFHHLLKHVFNFYTLLF